MYSLHNSDFGGVYFYLWEAPPPLYEPFHKLVESQGLPLHLGEPEMPYEIEYASAIYKDSSIAAEYVCSYARRPDSGDGRITVARMPPFRWRFIRVLRARGSQGGLRGPRC
jgi:hypothetical protein